MNISIPPDIFFGYYDILKKEQPNLCEDKKFANIKNEIISVLRMDSGIIKKPNENECKFCGSGDDVFPHHKDGNHSNNDPNNILIVCRSCHLLLHKRIDRQANGGCKQWYK